MISLTFAQLLGFSDKIVGYDATKNLLKHVNGTITSCKNGKIYSTGTLEIVSLSELREQVSKIETCRTNKLRHSPVERKDVKKYICSPDYSGAMFQVASQFNILEMASPELTPDDGIEIYWKDPTQGPKCSQAAIGATLYRNYFIQMPNGGIGQTIDNQINCLINILNWIEAKKSFNWQFQNGYIFIDSDGFVAINQVIENLTEVERDKLRGMLQIGIHWNVQVNDECNPLGQHVSQIFCSAFPVSYNREYNGVRSEETSSLSKLILEATQEATIISAILNKQRFGENQLVLTKPGGGAFGNRHIWIFDALERALKIYKNHDLDILLHHFSDMDLCYNTLEA